MVASASASASPIWPKPKSVSLSGPGLALSPSFAFTVADESLLENTRLPAAIEKYQQIVAKITRNSPPSTSAVLLETLELRLINASAASFARYPGLDTDYSYRMTVSKGQASAESSSQVGVTKI